MEKLMIRCNGGVSALSAFFTGFGSSIALDMPLEITMSESEEIQQRGTGAITRTLDLLEERFHIGGSYRISVNSTIPRGKGLKSSSALTLAIISGFLELNGISMGEGEMLGMAADISIENGTSSTGAYDDLSSAYYGGLCFTDNKQRKLLFRREVEKSPVLIAYDRSRRSSSSVNLDEMARYTNHAERIMDLIREGRQREAMVLNGNLLGYIYGQNSTLVRFLLSSGALYSGQCGKGPSVFAIFRNEEEMANAVREMEPGFKVQYRKTSFSNIGLVKIPL